MHYWLTSRIICTCIHLVELHDLHDPTWHCMSLHDLAWVCITLHEFYMTLHTFAWLCMTLNDFAWICVTLRNFAWLSMTLHDFAYHLTHPYIHQDLQVHSKHRICQNCDWLTGWLGDWLSVTPGLREASASKNEHWLISPWWLVDLQDLQSLSDTYPWNLKNFTTYQQNLHWKPNIGLVHQ